MPTPKVKINREFLFRRYVKDKISMKKIGEELGVSADTIHSRLKEFDIPRRKTGIRKGQKLSLFQSQQISLSKRGDKNPAWKGGRIINDGYVYLHRPNHPLADSLGYVAEHRLIAEKVLGKHLKANEIPHHINLNKSDNRNSNLLICTKEYNTWLHAKIRRLKLIEYFENL